MRSTQAPQTVAYCHCEDCRRITGAPVAALAAFSTDALVIEPASDPASVHTGVVRWFCRSCGSPLATQFDDLPGQTYVPLGVINQIVDLPPQLHCHDHARLPWLTMDDALPRHDGSGRAALHVTASSP